METSDNVKERIAQLNDALRQSLDFTLGTIVFAGALALHPNRDLYLSLVRQFNSWNHKNNPYLERDAAIIKQEEEEDVYFKIDYYDRESYHKQKYYGSDEPENPQKTFRVMTIMFISDY